MESLCRLKIENEIIVVNDGTKDSSLEIVERFKENHKNENIIIISQKNQGLSEARNNGLKAAKGEYISFIDSDDFVDTENYEKFINEVIEDKVDIGIGRYKKIIEKNNGTELECVTEIRNYDKGEIRTCMDRKYGMIFSGGNFCWKTAYFLRRVECMKMRFLQLKLF